MNIRPATKADLAPWLAQNTASFVRAYVAEHDGQVVAFGGVALSGGFHEAFSRVLPDAREIPGASVGLGRLAHQVRRLIVLTGGRVHALCDSSEPTSPALLRWCGFTEMSNGVWRYE